MVLTGKSIKVGHSNKDFTDIVIMDDAGRWVVINEKQIKTLRRYLKVMIQLEKEINVDELINTQHHSEVPEKKHHSYYPPNTMSCWSDGINLYTHGN